MEESTKKAAKKNKDVAALLLGLWNSGAFKGVIDKRTGKEVTYERAVDGMMGGMTRQAMDNNKLRRDSIKVNTLPRLQKVSTPSKLGDIRNTIHNSSIGGMDYFNYRKGLLPDSKESNLPAIFEHKTKYNITNPYGVLDKLNQILNIYRGDSLIKSYPVTLGLNSGDGMPDLSAKYLSETPKTTGAGIFNIQSLETSPYMGHEPLFRMIPDSLGTVSLAIHSPAGPSRISAIKNKSRATYGCANGLCGVTSDIYNNKLLTDRDTIYVLPEVEGNKIIERNGKLQMHWGGNNPQTYVDSKGTTRKFRYNNKK